MDWKNDLKALLTQGKNEDARQLCLTHRPLFLYRYRSSIGKLDYRKDELLGKLFKTPISERWGKQICLNE